MNIKINDSDLIHQALTNAFEDSNLRIIKPFQLTEIQSIVNKKKMKTPSSEKDFDIAVSKLLDQIE